MPTRRTFPMAITLGVSAFAMRLRAESGKRAKHVGIVYQEPPDGPDERRGWVAFDREMRELGWGRKVGISYSNVAIPRRSYASTPG